MANLEYSGDPNDNDTDLSDSPEFQAETTQHSHKKPRSGNACLTCRRMKTRCEYFDDTSPCTLCAKSNRECVKSPPRRKRQRTVARIADLEQRIQSLTSALIDNAPIDDRRLAHASPNSTSTSDAAPTGKSSSDVSPQARIESITPDVIDKGLVDKITGYAAFHRYREKMDQYYGFVPLPPDLDIDIYRRRKPLLFSTLVLAGISAMRPDLKDGIADDLLRAFSDRIHYRAERSLELVQCLLIYICYYSQTLQRRHLNFYQHITTALTMALDLGLGRRLGNTSKPRWIAEEDMMDARRAYLGCYYMSGQASISLRHPIFIRWGPYIEECLNVLSTDPRRAPDDVWLVDLIRLQRIAEDAHLIFSMDDPVSTVSLKEPKVQYHLASLEQQLERWRKEAKGDLTALRARLCVENVNIYIHELALHSHQNIDSFRSPPDPEYLASFFNDMDIGPARIDSLCSCLESAHAYLDGLLKLDIDTLRCLPNMYYVRSGYAAMALKWLDEICGEKSSRYLSDKPTSTSTSDHTTAKKTLRPTLSVKFEWYMDNVIKLYREVGKDGKYNIASAFCQALSIIKDLRLRTTIDKQTQSSSIPTKESTKKLVSDTVAAPAASATAETTLGKSYPFTSAPIEGSISHPQYAIHEDDGEPEFNFNVPGLDTAMFDVGTLNYFDPGFMNVGFWDLGGWNGSEEPVGEIHGNGNR